MILKKWRSMISLTKKFQNNHHSKSSENDNYMKSETKMWIKHK